MMVDQNDLDLYERIQSSSFDRAKATLSFIDDVISRYDVKNLALAFNGGKDCTVLLELIRAALAHKQQSISQLRVLYFDEVDAFDEMTTFLHATRERYHLKVETLHGSNHRHFHGTTSL
jgi:FAD synthetase